MNQDNLKTKIHYGEYSLTQWVKLILTKNIILPDYQRYFVWDRNAVKDFIDSLKKGYYIPPVTIGSILINDIPCNIIIDGQQRLTSLLLAYLNIFPHEQNNGIPLGYASEDKNDDEVDSEYDSRDFLIDWTFRKLTSLGSTKENILRKIGSEYNDLGDMADGLDYDNTYLGFSYIVPQSSDNDAQNKYYSSVFRNINIQGKVLSSQESRKSLYYLQASYAKIFDPDFCKYITIRTANKKDYGILDFVRYLSLLSEYDKNGKNANIVAKKYYGKMEGYYEKYIYDCVQCDNNKFKIIDNSYVDKIDKLSEIIDKWRWKDMRYNTIIKMDLHFFGLIYNVVFLDKGDELLSKENEFILKIDNCVDAIYMRYKKAKDNHMNSPSAFKYLRTRIKDSINLYSALLKNE